MKHFYVHIAMWSTVMLATAQAALDPTFGTGGKALINTPNTVNNQLRDVVTTSDNKLIIYKTLENKTDGSSDVVLNKLLPDGSVDLSFGTQGQTLININAKDQVSDVVVLGHDVLLVVGTTVDGSGKAVPFVTKVTPTGNIDATFGIKTYSTLNLGHDLALTAATLSILNNRIIIAGHATNPYTGNKDFLALAIDFTGALVNNFGGGGVAWLEVSGDTDICNDVSIWPYSTSILLSGYTKSSPRDKFAMVLLHEDGQFSPILRGTGKLTFNVSQTGHDRALKAAIDPIHQVAYLVGYSALSNKEVVALAEVSMNGIFNPYFDFDGKKVWYIGGKNDRANNIAITGNGHVFVSGTTQQYDNTYRPFVIKLLKDGTGDSKLAANGILTITHNVDNAYTTGISIQNATQVVLSAVNKTDGATVVARVQDIYPSLAKFEFENETQCDARIKFMPAEIYPREGHRWFYGDNSEMTTDPVGFHQYPYAGYYNVLHVYKASEYSDDELFYQTIFVDKAPYVYSAKFAAGVLASEHNIFLYAANTYHENGISQTYDYTINYPGSTAGTYGVTYDKAGFYTYDYAFTRTDLPENSCATTYNTGKFIVADQSYGYADSITTEQLGNNLVINGGFDSSCFNSPEFSSDYWRTCYGAGYTTTFQEYAIVNDVHDYSYEIENNVPVPSSIGTEGLNGNFLYVPEINDDLPYKIYFHGHVRYLNIWQQKVYVEAGSTYHFKTNVFNVSAGLADQYAFPYIALAVDEEPLQLNMIGRESMVLFNSYTATKTGWVTARIIKYEGVPAGIGSIGIDDIYFGKINNNAAARTTSNAEEQLNVTTIAPNPATDQVTVSSSYDVEALNGGRIEILNVASGKLLKKFKTTSTQTQLDVSDLSTGMYLVKIYAHNGDLLDSQKLVINQ